MTDTRIGGVLVAMGAIRAAELTRALCDATTAGRQLGDALVASGVVEKTDVERAAELQDGLRHRKVKRRALAAVDLAIEGSRRNAKRAVDVRERSAQARRISTGKGYPAVKV